VNNFITVIKTKPNKYSVKYEHANPVLTSFGSLGAVLGARPAETSTAEITANDTIA